MMASMLRLIRFKHSSQRLHVFTILRAHLSHNAIYINLNHQHKYYIYGLMLDHNVPFSPLWATILKMWFDKCVLHPEVFMLGDPTILYTVKAIKLFEMCVYLPLIFSFRLYSKTYTFIICLHNGTFLLLLRTLIYETRREKTGLRGFPAWSDTN